MLDHVPNAQLDFLGPDTVAGVFARHVRETPDAPFLVFEEAPGSVRTLTYAQMNARADRAAQLLRAAGIGPGRRFVIHLANCIEFYDMWLAAAKSRAVMVPTNPLSTADELHYVLEHSQISFTVTSGDLLDCVRAAHKQLPDGGESGRVLVIGDPAGLAPGESYEAALAEVPDQPVDARPEPADVVGILYTSGTTSRPKGVLITNTNYLYVGRVCAEYMRLRPEDRNLVVLPLFHGNAQYYSSMSAIVTGCSIALTPRFSASRWSEQATVLAATTASLFAAPIRMMLAQEPSSYDRAHSVRLALFAQNLSEGQPEEFERRYGLRLAQLYGMTETIAPSTLNPLYGERRHHTIGRPTPGVPLRVVDEDGRDVEPGEPGELLVGGLPGRTLMLGYLDNPDATAEALEPVGDGPLRWLRTGDNVRVDAEGYLHFVDRGKDVIKRAGENVASGEVERVVNDHPAVFESAAIGIPDEMRDEAIKMYVVLHEGATATEQEIIDFARERLAKFKVPSAVEFIDSLPRTSVGKIQKHLLRKRARDRT